LVGQSLTALLTQFRSYRAFKVKTIVNIKDLIEDNSWSKVNEKRKKKYIYIYNSTKIRLNEEIVIKLGDRDLGLKA